MIHNPQPSSGGLRPLLEEALPANVTAALIFANAPSGCIGVTLSVYSGTLHISMNGTTPVAGSVGHAFEAGVYDLSMQQAKLALIKAIGGVSGYITYWGG